MESIKKNRDFKKVYGKKQSVANRYLVLYIRRNGMSVNRLGISISRKVGCAVVRNRIRRLIKEQMRLNEKAITEGYDLVIVVRPAATEADFHQIGFSLAGLLDKQKLKKG